jgi:hypothetical protein
MEAIIEANEIILPEKIRLHSKKADVIQSEDFILIMPRERELLKGIVRGRSKKSSVELVREIRDENEARLQK